MNEHADDGAAGGIWDRVWRGRASSKRRALGNAALAASRCASIIAEGARLVDQVTGPNRSLEIHGLANELTELADSMRAIADYLHSEAGEPATGKMTVWYNMRRTFMRWLRE